ncbi:hypothetical protein F5884DRAFT_869104 [Xylogone sp. PMI_703]|nr:hypothetical protein F5884DRAFT_869104 [Xylogone sp. PMI_703]
MACRDLCFFFLFLCAYACYESHRVKELFDQLSSEAKIYYKGSPNFTTLTANWNPALCPQIDIAVEAATLSDIRNTIAFSRLYGRTLVIRTTGHGKSRKLSDVQHGIQLSLRQLNGIRFDNAANTVTIGAGVLNYELVAALWANKKRTAALGCDCVSIVGAALGGGHGREQGLYGLVSDQVVSIRLLTADGKLIEASKTRNPELFWAMRGAGHNFGVALAMTLQLYDTPPGWGHDYFLGSYFFDTEELDEVVQSLYLTIQGPQDPDLTIFAEFQRFHIKLHVQYGGRRPIGELIPHILSLQTIRRSNMTVAWPNIPTATGYGINGTVCQIKPDSYHSSMKLIVTLETYYSKFDAAAEANEIVDAAKRVLLRNQAEARAYVNYANGDEGEGACYGDEIRLQRLRKLKHTYDPDGVFSLFGPITARASSDKDEL